MVPRSAHPCVLWNEGFHFQPDCRAPLDSPDRTAHGLGMHLSHFPDPVVLFRLAVA